MSIVKLLSIVMSNKKGSVFGLESQSRCYVKAHAKYLTDSDNSLVSGVAVVQR